MVRCLLFTIGVLLLSVVGGSTTQAQSTHNHAFCGVDFSEGQVIKDRMLDNRRNKETLMAALDASRGNDSTVYVPVIFHIVNKTDGTGGETIKDILANLCKLNDDYRHINVEFYLAGPIRFINQDLLYTNDFSTGMANFFMQLYRVPSVVNIFVGNQIVGGVSGGTTLGYYTSGLDIIYAIRSSVHGTATTLTHELGHFFSLPHTFFGWEGLQYSDPNNSGVTNVMSNTNGRTPSITLNGVPVEVIYRTGGKENCQIAADGFCDTDPNYLFGFYGNLYNNNGCNYAATAHDPNGWLFRPEMIAPKAYFRLVEGDDEFTSIEMTNRSTKDKIFSRTLMVTEVTYEIGGNITLISRDTLGDTDSTDVEISKNSRSEIIGITPKTLKKGVLNLRGRYFGTNVASTTAPSLVFYLTPTKYSVDTIGNHDIDNDTLIVTNTSGSVTVTAGTTVDVTDIFYNDNNTPISSSVRTYNLPNDLAPGESHIFTTVALKKDNEPSIAGVKLQINTYAPYKSVTGTTSENVMSYYPDACATQFSVEQGNAMKLDIAARAFTTVYPKPTDSMVIDTVVLIHPLNGAVAPQPLVNLQWNAVTYATMYHVHIFELNILGLPLINGEFRDFTTTTNSAWVTLTPNKRYGWRVTPLNAVSFCSSFVSQQANFEVKNWTVGVDQVQAEIEDSKLYPNPSGLNQDVVLEITSSIIGDAQVNILNSIGQEVMPTQNISLVQGSNVQKLSTMGLAAGLYVVNVKTKNGMISHKMVIKD